MPNTWQEAEALAVRYMRALGFADAQQTSAGADGGIDAVSPAHRAAAQVKHYAAFVGRPEVQKLVGAASLFSERLFFTSSGYTAAAAEYAEAHDVALFTYDINDIVTPCSTRAAELSRRLDAETQLNRIRQREQELAMEEHLRRNPPPSAWTYERTVLYPLSLVRILALDDVWSALIAMLDQLHGTQSEPLATWLNGERAAIGELTTTQGAAETTVPRDWAGEQHRLEQIRERVRHLEAQWARYLAQSADVCSLVDAASTLIVEDSPPIRRAVGEGFAPGPVPPVAQAADWSRLWHDRAVALVRYVALNESLVELNGRIYYQLWRLKSGVLHAELEQAGKLINSPEGWVGPAHFNVWSVAVAEAHGILAATEHLLAGTFGRDLNIRKLVDKHAARWMARNKTSTEIAQLVATGFISTPL